MNTKPEVSPVTTAALERHTKSPDTGRWSAILVGGLIAGTIDVGSASIINWISPVLILQAIASGVLGKASFQAGLPAAVLGLGLQWGMSLLIATVYVLGIRKLPFLRKHWITTGVIYGIAIYAVMNYIVVPLSAAPFNPHFSISKIIENLLAMVLFGLIITGSAHHLCTPRRLQQAQR